MAARRDFTDDEWKIMQKGVTGAAMMVSVGHRDFTDTFGEVGALAKFLAGREERAESQFIRELADVRGTGFGITDSSQDVEAETIAALGSAVTILEGKAPEETAAYRGLALDAARIVAEAKGDVAPEEASALQKIEAALGA
jgi:hypothetical protein